MGRIEHDFPEMSRSLSFSKCLVHNSAGDELMTYKLNPIIEKIESPVKLILVGECREYKDGSAASNDSFDKNLIRL